MTEATLADLIPDPRNARRHNPRNIGMIVDSLHQVGAARSIVIDEDNVILAGNGVIEAAAEAGIMDVRIIEASGNEIIAVKRSGLTPEQKTKLALFDNRTAELADWDADILNGLDIDLGDLWFDNELAEMGIGLDEPTEDPGPQIDKAAELQEKWQTKRGQVWEIGKHRLMCGDSTSAEDVGRLMGGEKAAMMWADPPYHVGKVFEGDLHEGNVWDDSFQRAWLNVAMGALDPKAQRYICFAPARSRDAILCYEPKRLLVWCKPFALMRANAWDWAYEFVAWCYDGDEPAYFDKPMGTASFDWQEIASVIHGHEGRHHITQKPIGLPSLHIGASSPDGALVYDPFLGSGTTMVAAEQTGRVCYGMEVEPKYCAVTLERMSGMGLELGRHKVRN
uniref:Putative methyltransferase n=1 Tax=viral metagenome TaxID=1070528 RepID=A0A6H1ZDM8_9ZZZZ